MLHVIWLLLGKTVYHFNRGIFLAFTMHCNLMWGLFQLLPPSSKVLCVKSWVMMLVPSTITSIILTWTFVVCLYLRILKFEFFFSDPSYIRESQVHGLHGGLHVGLHVGSAATSSQASATVSSAVPADLPNKRPRIDLSHQSSSSVSTPLTVDTREASKVGNLQH